MLGVALKFRYGWHLIPFEMLALVVFGPMSVGIGWIGPSHAGFVHYMHLLSMMGAMFDLIVAQTLKKHVCRIS